MDSDRPTLAYEDLGPRTLVLLLIPLRRYSKTSVRGANYFTGGVRTKEDSHFTATAAASKSSPGPLTLQSAANGVPGSGQQQHSGNSNTTTCFGTGLLQRQVDGFTQAASAMGFLRPKSLPKPNALLCASPPHTTKDPTIRVP